MRDHGVRWFVMIAALCVGSCTETVPDDFFVEDRDPATITWLAPVASEPLELNEPVDLAVFTGVPESREVHFSVDGHDVGVCSSNDPANDCYGDSVFRSAVSFATTGTHTLVASFTTADGRTVRSSVD